MPEHNDTQRFDRLLDAMVNKPPLEKVQPHDEQMDDDDKREDDEG
ncbi:hypothetical protein GCM10009116_19710 [Brevundimonas basaltis]|uniref:Uncharacterized protein n=1 Tax=Brevundimonas basaltis TaxID=472166 RepID=A0A7W8HXG2_9CAUL|nr:hypothetical protein [Brevundimonas basaltis]MBB5291724.1 hypothetical protein [Brevundimonas basaltis]